MKAYISMDEIDVRRENDGYEKLLESVQKEFKKNVEGTTDPIFRTNASELYSIFLDNLPAVARQYYNCDACRRFVNWYGGLVRVDSTGRQHPIMWGTNIPEFFADSVAAIRDVVKNAKVTGVFITANRRLGTPLTGSWSHFSVELPADRIFANKILAPSQAEAEKAQDHRMLIEAIKKYDVDTAAKAVNLLRSGTMYGSDKVVGMAEWFFEVLQSVKGKRKQHNLLWYVAATAPKGFCHISNTVVGTLMDDINNGFSVETISKKFSEKMEPTQYQRPQAAPASGNVAQAERIVERLGIENSLKRRFARLDEIETIWTPQKTRRELTNRTGVFSGVKTKEQRDAYINNHVDVPTVTMTWEKFRRTVLNSARKIEFYVSGARDSYGAILTAVDPSSPPIIKWDMENDRCPFNWYVYSGGSYPGAWGLSNGYVEVTGVALQPNMWRKGPHTTGEAVFFILKNCKDHRYKTAGIALFPETLKSELREVRSTIEAYSNANVLDGYDEASACGIRMQASSKWWDYRVRVTTDVGTTIYKLDRWD